MQKPVPESLDRTLDPRAFDHINADTNHAHLVTSADRPVLLGQALRVPDPATGAVALQFCPASDTDALPSSALALSSGIIGHSGEHFFHGIFQANPHRARDDCVADIEFVQTRNLVDKRDVSVIDAVTCIHLQMRF